MVHELYEKFINYISGSLVLISGPWLLYHETITFSSPWSSVLHGINIQRFINGFHARITHRLIAGSLLM